MTERNYLIAALVIALASLYAQWLQRDLRWPSAYARFAAGERVVVGYALEPPFALIDRTGQVSGEAPELFRHLAAELGPGRFEWVHADFGSLIHELEVGRIDVIAAGMFITPERARRVLFTRPTARVCPALLVAAGNPHGLRSLADFVRQPALRLGVIDAAVEAGVARAAGIPEMQLVLFPDAVSAGAAVGEGRVDAFMLATISLRHMLQSKSDHRLEIAALHPEDGTQALATGRPAFVFRTEDRAFRDAVDAALERFVGSAAHLALVAPFGFTSAEIAAGDEAAECRP